MASESPTSGRGAEQLLVGNPGGRRLRRKGDRACDDVFTDAKPDVFSPEAVLEPEVGHAKRWSLA